MKFVVSGQPKLGHESWPPLSDDKSLSDRLYHLRGADEETRLEIKFEKIGDRCVAYYHFSKLNNVTSCLTEEEKKQNPYADHGRKGSFFVMSVRIDGFYSTDFTGIYNLLQNLYDNHVNERVLKRSKEKFLVYQIMKLEDAKETWEHIEQELNNEKDVFRHSKRIPANYNSQGAKSPDYFMVGDDGRDIEEAILKNGRAILLSHEEMDARRKRIAEAKQQEELNDLDGKVSQTEVDDSSQKGHQKKHEVYSLSDISAPSQTPSVMPNTEGCYAGGDYSCDSISEERRNGANKVSKFKLNKVLLIILLIGELLCFYNIKKLNNKVKDLQEQLSTLYAVEEQKDTDPDSKTDTKGGNKGESSTDSEAIDGEMVDNENSLVTKLDMRQKSGKSTIDVTNNTMKTGYTYFLIAKTGMAGQRVDARGTGSFSCNVNQGITIQQDGNKCQITIVHKDPNTDKVTVTYAYTLNGQNKKFEREIYIQ